MLPDNVGRSLIRVKPKLAEGHSLPTKPVYWLIWMYGDMKEGGYRPYHSRLTRKKVLTPREAAWDCYGIDPTENMVFFNLTSRVTDMRRMMVEIRKLWAEAVKVK